MDPRDVADAAEAATLGAFLLDPAPLGEVRRWLRPGDFADSWHRWVFTAVLERHTAGQRVDPLVVGADLRARYGTRLADLPRLHTLVAGTPHPGHGPEYARTVAESGLRRETASLGVLLRAAAAQSAFDHSPVPVAATCNLVDAGLDTAAARWATATGRPHEQVVVPLALRAAARNGEAREGAARYLDVHPARDPAAEHAHVIALVGTLIAHPEHIATVAAWLPASRIGDPAWRLIYATTVELAELGQPVDLVTVAAASTRYAHHGPTLPTLVELGDVVDAGWLAWPPHLVRTVAGDLLRSLADFGADQLRHAAANPGVQIGDIADIGHALTTTLRHTATALPAAPARPIRPAQPIVRLQGLGR